MKISSLWEGVLPEILTGLELAVVVANGGGGGGRGGGEEEEEEEEMRKLSKRREWKDKWQRQKATWPVLTNKQLSLFITGVSHELVLLHRLTMMYILSVNRHLYTSIASWGCNNTHVFSWWGSVTRYFFWLFAGVTSTVWWFQQR